MTEPQDPGAFHLGIEAISDLDEGLLSAPDAQAAREHLAGCAQCQDDQRALAAVRETLAGEQDITMPDDVAARIFGALDALDALDPVAARSPLSGEELSATEVPVGAAVTTLPAAGAASGWQRAQKPVLAWLGAAATVALLVVGITQLGGGSSSEKSTASTAGTTAAVVVPVTTSGRHYTAAGLGAQALALLPGGTTVTGSSAGQAAAPVATEGPSASAAGTASAQTPAGATSVATSAGPRSAAPQVPAPDQASPSRTATASSPALAQAVDPLAALRTGDAAQVCLMSLEPSSGTPLAIDFGSLAGKPAVIGVFQDPGNAARLQVIAVGPPGCTLLSYGEATRP